MLINREVYLQVRVNVRLEYLSMVVCNRYLSYAPNQPDFSIRANTPGCRDNNIQVSNIPTVGSPTPQNWRSVLPATKSLRGDRHNSPLAAAVSGRRLKKFVKN